MPVPAYLYQQHPDARFRHHSNKPFPGEDPRQAQARMEREWVERGQQGLDPKFDAQNAGGPAGPPLPNALMGAGPGRPGASYQSAGGQVTLDQGGYLPQGQGAFDPQGAMQGQAPQIQSGMTTVPGSVPIQHSAPPGAGGPGAYGGMGGPTQITGRGDEALDQGRTAAFGRLHDMRTYYEGQQQQDLLGQMQAAAAGVDVPYTQDVINSELATVSDSVAAAEASNMDLIDQNYAARGQGQSGGAMAAKLTNRRKHQAEGRMGRKNVRQNASQRNTERRIQAQQQVAGQFQQAAAQQAQSNLAEVNMLMQAENVQSDERQAALLAGGMANFGAGAANRQAAPMGALAGGGRALGNLSGGDESSYGGVTRIDGMNAQPWKAGGKSSGTQYPQMGLGGAAGPMGAVERAHDRSTDRKYDQGYYSGGKKETGAADWLQGGGAFGQTSSPYPGAAGSPAPGVTTPPGGSTGAADWLQGGGAFGQSSSPFSLGTSPRSTGPGNSIAPPPSGNRSIMDPATGAADWLQGGGAFGQSSSPGPMASTTGSVPWLQSGGSYGPQTSPAPPILSPGVASFFQGRNDWGVAPASPTPPSPPPSYPGMSPGGVISPPRFNSGGAGAYGSGYNQGTSTAVNQFTGQRAGVGPAMAREMGWAF